MRAGHDDRRMEMENPAQGRDDGGEKSDIGVHETAKFEKMQSSGRSKSMSSLDKGAPICELYTTGKAGVEPSLARTEGKEARVNRSSGSTKTAD